MQMGPRQNEFSPIWPSSSCFPVLTGSVNPPALVKAVPFNLLEHHVMILECERSLDSRADRLCTKSRSCRGYLTLRPHLLTLPFNSHAAMSSAHLFWPHGGGGVSQMQL